MSASEKLVIRIEIEAPLGATVSIDNAHKKDSDDCHGKADGKPLKTSGPGTSQPAAGTTFAMAAGSAATSGTICVRGNSGGENHDIFVALDSTSMPSSKFATSDSQGNWAGELSGVACGPYSSPIPHFVKVWRVKNGGTPEPEVINFQAVCAPYHNCTQSVGVVGIPIAWPTYRVVVNCGGCASAFHGEHFIKLSRVLSNDAVLIWTNDVACSKTPQISLTLHRTGVPRWELKFAHGDAFASYSKMHSDWNAIGANILSRDCCCQDAAVTVEVHPAS